MNFYNHPLIDLIVEHDICYEEDLEKLSGLDPLEFRRQFKNLIKEDHIWHGDDVILCRALILGVSDKQSKRYIEAIDLKYLSKKELRKIIFYDENDVDVYLCGILLEEKQVKHFELDNDFEVNFEENEYRLFFDHEELFPGSICKKEIWELGGHIVQVGSDDLFAKELRILFEREFPSYYLFYFTNAEYAWKFLNRHFQKGISIELIVTDISLPGIAGVAFAESVRKLEFEYKHEHIPIVALGLCDEGNSVKEDTLKKNVFDKCFTKDVDIKKLNEYFKTVIDDKEKIAYIQSQW